MRTPFSNLKPGTIFSFIDFNPGREYVKQGIRLYRQYDPIADLPRGPFYHVDEPGEVVDSRSGDNDQHL